MASPSPCWRSRGIGSRCRPSSWRTLKRINRKLGSAPTGLTAKNQDLVRRFEDRELLLALLDLPEKLQAQLRTRRLSPARRLQKIQIALAIELLLAAPMRLQNLAMLELDRSLQWPSGRNGPVYVVLRRDETKNELPLEYPLEGRTRDLLHEYLDRYRSYAKHQGSALAVRAHGRHAGCPTARCAMGSPRRSRGNSASR